MIKEEKLKNEKVFLFIYIFFKHYYGKVIYKKINFKKKLKNIKEYK